MILNLKNIDDWLIIMLIGIMCISFVGIMGILNEYQLTPKLTIIAIIGFILLIGGFIGSIIFVDKKV